MTQSEIKVDPMLRDVKQMKFAFWIFLGGLFVLFLMIGYMQLDNKKRLDNGFGKNDSAVSNDATDRQQIMSNQQSIMARQRMQIQKLDSLLKTHK